MSRPDVSIRRRGASDDADDAFIAALIRQVIRENLGGDALPRELSDALVEQQARLQALEYARAYPDATEYVIDAGGARRGRVVVVWGARLVRFVDVAITPEWRGQGIGTAALRWLLSRSEARGRPATLHVTTMNPARRLYERLGFEFQGTDGVHVHMVRAPEM